MILNKYLYDKHFHIDADTYTIHIQALLGRLRCRGLVASRNRAGVIESHATAISVEDLASDIRGALRGQKCRDLPDFIRIPDAIHRCP